MSPTHLSDKQFITLVSLYCHSTVTPLPLYCHSTVTLLPLYCHSAVTLLSLYCHSVLSLIGWKSTLRLQSLIYTLYVVSAQHDTKVLVQFIKYVCQCSDWTAAPSLHPNGWAVVGLDMTTDSQWATTWLATVNNVQLSYELMRAHLNLFSLFASPYFKVSLFARVEEK